MIVPVANAPPMLMCPVEQGVKTGFSGNNLRRSPNCGPQYRIIAATTDGEIRAPEIRVVTYS